MAINTNNYSVGMCELFFGVGEAGEAQTSLGMVTTFGNVVAGEIAPEITYLDHYISIEGDRRKDKTVAVLKSVSIPFTFDEINEDNLRGFLYAVAASNNKAMAMQKSPVPVEGRAMLRFHTAIGKSFSYYIPRCALKSDGGLSFNIEDWMSGKFVLEVLRSQTTAYTASPYGTIDLDLSASATLSDCESAWTLGPGAAVTAVVLSNSTAQVKVGSNSLKVRVNASWDYVAASGIKGQNCLGYVALATKVDLTQYYAVKFWVRASKDFNASDLYLGFEKTATPIGAPVDYVAIRKIQGGGGVWEQQYIPIRDLAAANATHIHTIGIYGTAAVDVAASPNIQAVWIDDIKVVK